MAVEGGDAFRFLSQATFGPSPASIAALGSKSYSQWMDEQMAVPWRALMPGVKARQLARLAPGSTSDPNPSKDIIGAFWREAIEGQAQLRWRTAYAMSQIFVYSVGGHGGFTDPVGSADYFDMLARNAFGNYRQLLESVARHPAMGRYLSHLGNRPADDKTGRVPDENFAREIMQLFSIGLYKLNIDGTLQLDASQRPIPTYGADDIVGLARVFTGWSWDCAEGRTKNCFTSRFTHRDGLAGDIGAGSRPMVGYPEYHSTEEKRFLGVVIPAQSIADPGASLKIALDTLANHPNVGPFIGRQLIQRLVTSNPSPAYVADVAAVFNNNGRGVRGDLGAVIRAILTHSEARTPGAQLGKVREPVLRLTALARAFPARSLSGGYWFQSEENYDVALGQVPLSSPSVFNFYRPGYAPRGGGLVKAGMVAPEMQIIDENSSASYVRYMRQAIESGFGAYSPGATKRDMQLDLSALIALADRPERLVDEIFGRLLGDARYPELRAEILQTVSSIPIPVPPKWSTGDVQIAVAKTKRTRMALLMTLAAPEFIVQH